MKLRLNLLANYLGQAWVAALGLVFLPLYIRYLGIEAYGLIGVFAILQAWLSIFDLGIGPALNRETARFTAGAHNSQAIADLLRSLEILAIGIAGAVCIALSLCAEFLAGDWLRSASLPQSVVAESISVMAIVIALRLVEGIYRSALLGLQRQIWFNSVNAGLAFLRWGGSVAVLAWISPTIKMFFAWQAAVSLLSILLFRYGTLRALPTSDRSARFSWPLITEVWKYAGGMVSVTLLTLVLTQVDKLMLSRLLSLEMFGYYSFSAAVATVFPLAVKPITQAVFPRMIELTTSASGMAQAVIYHRSAQLVTVVTAPIALLLGLSPAGVILMWSGDADLAAKASPILAALVFGSFLNGLMWVPYHMQLAYGWTSLAVKCNLAAVVVYVPALFWVIPQAGAAGAAWLWVALNAAYVLIAIHFMHRRIISGEKFKWYVQDLALPISGALAVVMVSEIFQPSIDASRIMWFFYFAISGILALLAAAFLSNCLRDQGIAALKSLRNRRNSVSRRVSGTP